MDPANGRGRWWRACRAIPGAEYVRVIEIDASRLRPMVALPGDPGNGVYIDELAEPVEIEIAYAGSCTAGKKDDMDMYARVFREAWETGGARGASRMWSASSSAARPMCASTLASGGYLDLFRAIGAEFIEPGCGACIAAGPGITRSAGPGVGLVPEPELPRAVAGRGSCTWCRRTRWRRRRWRGGWWGGARGSVSPFDYMMRM